MLSCDWRKRKQTYDFIVVGSGYGGAITAARMATADLNPKPSLCILERGREWKVGKFPDTPDALAEAFRSNLNPLGLYELLRYQDISVVKGSGLGGTSLINANVAAVPDPEVFEQAGWPRTITLERLEPYLDRARATLGAGPHPRAFRFPKVQAMDRRAQQAGLKTFPLDLAINFTLDGRNAYGVIQKPCLGCGDCTTGCNRMAKNTLYMNYLPMARNAGAEIYTQVKVERIEKLAGGGWRVHGRNYEESAYGTPFKLEARAVTLAAGSINTTEILMRSETRGLSLAPAVGTRFSCNGDFFGLAYNGDYRTQVSGFGSHTQAPGAQYPPGPAIISAIHYNGKLPLSRRFQIEDLSIPSAYVAAARQVFPTLGGEDTDTGDEAEERRRIARDRDVRVAYDPDGALNHTMFYLVMGIDDARGSMVFEAPWHERDGRLRVVWSEAGRQEIYTRLDAELRRHARALGATYVRNPVWSFFNLRHLITAHPIGGCPMGEDYTQGAVDEFGRVFAGDGSVHQGLLVADAALIPTSIGVNPFMTISALAERVAERKIRELQGDAYPEPARPVSIPALDPLEVVNWEEPALERLFRQRPSQGPTSLVNSGAREIDRERRLIRSDVCWKGFFPRGHVLNAMSSALFAGFRKEFQQKSGRYVGVTSDADGRIRARNTVEEKVIQKRTGDLEPGRYLLLRYLDPPWQGFYDVLKVVSDDLVIGRVYLGAWPNGVRLFTFAMTRVYGFGGMSADDHRELYQGGTVPAREDLDGAWRMDVISNARQAAGLAYLQFDLKPDGRLESRYQLAGLLEGLLTPSFLAGHFRLDDFTGFHDEIRRIDRDLLVGKYVIELPEGLAALGPAGSLGLFHSDSGGRFGFYYLLTRAVEKEFPTNTILRPFLDVHLPDGLGMTFDEEMIGWYFPGQFTAGEGRAGDLTIGGRIPENGTPQGAVEASFRLRMSIADLNEFIDGREHEARAKGTISFGEFEGAGPVTHHVDERRSYFNYLRVNEATGEAEMRYHLEFETETGRRFTFEGRKYMQKDETAGAAAAREVLEDYTTLFAHVYEQDGRELGTAWLKFRTFEDLAATGSFLEFLRSLR